MRLVAIGIVHLNGFLVALSLLPLRRSRRGATAPPFVALVFEIALIVVVGRVLQVILVIEIALAICPGVGSSARVHRSVTTVGPVERAHAKGRGGGGGMSNCVYWWKAPYPRGVRRNAPVVPDAAQGPASAIRHPLVEVSCAN